jgi:hypothetical protein
LTKRAATDRRRAANLKPVAQIARPRLDRLALWLGRQSRAVRIILAGLIAAVTTGAVALLLFGLLLSLPPEKLYLGPITPDNISAVLLILLAAVGFLFYWVGWRVLVGFDLDETPTQPGRAGALWLVFGAVMLIGTLVVVLLSAFQASSAN